MIRLLTILALGLAWLVTSPAPLRADTVRFFQDGLPRRVKLHIPDSVANPAPLVIVLHGVLENDNRMRKITDRQFEALADRDGFVVAQTSAFLRVWQIGEGEGAARLRPQRDDFAYLERVIAEASERAPIDPDRIFLAGFSQGGIMSYAFACKTPGRVRAISVVAMGLPHLLIDDCRGHAPEGVQLIHGTDDVIVPFDDGLVPSGPVVFMRLYGHRATTDFFARQLACGPRPAATVLDAEEDGTRVLRRVWRGCGRGRLEAYEIVGGGHTWPSGGPDLIVTGRSTQEIDGAAVAWGFFSRFD